MKNFKEFLKESRGMNKLKDGTEYRDVANGIVAVRGKRELYLLGTSVNQMKKARELLANNSFNVLFKKGKLSPQSKNVAYIKIPSNE